MADEAAVLEAPELIADEVVEQPNEQQLETPEPAPVEEVKGDERVMPQWIRNLKATDPAAFKEAKATFFGKRTLDEKLKDFDLDGTRGWLTEAGGREAIESQLTELQGKAQELEGIASKMATGDPSLIADFVAASPEGFAKIAPVVVSEWARTDPEGWGHAMTGVLAATLTQENQAGDSVASVIKDIGIALRYADNEGVKAAVEKLQGWANGMITAGRSPLQRPSSMNQPAKDDGRLKAVEQREQQLFNQEMGTAVDSFRQPLIAKELDSFFKRRPNDTDAKDLAINTVKSQVVERLKGDHKYQDSLNALWARKDRDGALKLIKSRETAAIQEIAPKVGRTIFGNPGGAAPVVQKQAGTPSKAEAGFSFTDKPPRPELIDRGKTSDAMIMRGKFILKDGQKLTLEA
jgi:hypothetical protein